MSLNNYKQLLEEHIESSSLRQTPERYTILNAIIELKTFDIDSLHTELIESGIVKPTIYNNIPLFLKCGIIKQKTPEANKLSRKAKFELITL